MTSGQKSRRLNAFRLFILAFAILLAIYGAVHGEAEAVFRKASSICLECIGIG